MKPAEEWTRSISGLFAPETRQATTAGEISGLGTKLVGLVSAKGIGDVGKSLFQRLQPNQFSMFQKQLNSVTTQIGAQVGEDMLSLRPKIKPVLTLKILQLHKTSVWPCKGTADPGLSKNGAAKEKLSGKEVNSKRSSCRLRIKPVTTTTESTKIAITEGFKQGQTPASGAVGTRSVKEIPEPGLSENGAAKEKPSGEEVNSKRAVSYQVKLSVRIKRVTTESTEVVATVGKGNRRPGFVRKWGRKRETVRRGGQQQEVAADDGGKRHAQ
ncbi:hypothetical protein C8R43DRAFT_960799 [Mycena crocata]|nr:hypothetical protein C8R43DRAFT_960799 [Mycena crocata]